MKQVFLILSFALIATACNKTNKISNNKTESSSSAIKGDITGTEWKLSELDGKPIKLDTTFKKEPHLIFENGTNKLTGNGGCNGFGGSYEIKPSNNISITIEGSTMMACPNLEIETQFHNALKQTTAYRLEGNNLFLENASKTIVAKLENKVK